MADSKPRRRTKRVKAKEGPLDVSDWVVAASEMLISENIRGVQISSLCAKLGVTKGSFYWHFASREELLEAVLQTWRRRRTLDVITRLKRLPMVTAEVLRTLLMLPHRPGAPAVAAVEMSIRDWSRGDAKTLQAIEEVDRIRFEFFEQLFRRQGYGGKEAKARGYMAYALMLGDSILKNTLPDAVPTGDYLDVVVKSLCGGLGDASPAEGTAGTAPSRP